MKKIVFIGLLVLLLFQWDNLSACAHEVELDLITEIIPEGWVLEWVFDNVFDQSSDNYLVLALTKMDKDLNRGEQFGLVYVVHNDGTNYQIVWQSSEFRGYVSQVIYADSNNDGKNDLNLNIVQKEGERFFSVLRIYDWKQENTKLIYPAGDFPVLESQWGFGIQDYDKDGNLEIAVMNNVTEWDKEVQHFEFRNNQMTFERTVTVSPPPGDDRTIEEIYPDLYAFVKTELRATLVEVDYISPDLSLAQIQDQSDQLSYVVLESNDEENTVSVYATLDSKFNEMNLLSDLTDCNLDGFPEVIFTQEKSDFVMYYMVALKPGKAELITPVDKNFNSLVWMLAEDGPFDIDDHDDDGLEEIFAEAFQDGEIVYCYWHWDESAQQFVKETD